MTVKITKKAAQTFADVLSISITRNKVTTGCTRVHLKALGGSFPFPLEIVDEFGSPETMGGDAGLLLRGPGSIAVFIGRHSEDRKAKSSKNRKESLDFALLDARVVEEKTGALAGTFEAFDIESVESFLTEFNVAVKKSVHREPGEVEWH